MARECSLVKGIHYHLNFRIFEFANEVHIDGKVPYKFATGTEVNKKNYHWSGTIEEARIVYRFFVSQGFQQLSKSA